MISIVTPSFRQPEWLRLCVASVADQEAVDLEHIVQDAGTDGIQESLRAQFGERLAQDSLRVFVEKDAGMYDAVNRGLARARGDICAYLNCDEQYLPGTLASVAKYFGEHPAVDILFGDVILVDQSGSPLSYRRTVLPEREHISSAHLNTTTCATFFRRRLLERGFSFDPQWKAIGDAVWIDTLLKNKVRMAMLERPLAVFTFTGQNLGATSLSRSESERWKSKTISPLSRLGTIVRHRWRKAVAGAYQSRLVEIEIYTLDSPTRRQRFLSRNVGFRWPKAAGASTDP